MIYDTEYYLEEYETLLQEGVDRFLVHRKIKFHTLLFTGKIYHFLRDPNIASLLPAKTVIAIILFHHTFLDKVLPTVMVLSH